MQTKDLATLSSALAGAQNVLSSLHYGHNKFGQRVLMLPANGPEIAAVNALVERLEQAAQSVSDQIETLTP